MTSISPDFIDMTGQRAPGFEVLEYAHARPRRAYWWIMCTACHHQQQERGCNIRKAQKRPEYRIFCKGCGR